MPGWLPGLLPVLLLLSGVGCQPQGETLPVPVLSPSEELATFQFAPGLRIELVASEPMVEEPVVMNFDEDGRLWVVEMRGFMPNIDGEGEDEPNGRVVVLEDGDGDGEMDRRTVFLDSLVMPRALAFVPGGVLVAESKPLWFVEDLDGDLQADARTLVDSTYGGRGLPEHSPNGLWRGLDNWYYNAKSYFRYKPVGDRWLRDSTEFRGQWGISHDDAGRLYYNYNWSQLHADFVPPSALMRNPHHIATSGIDEGLTTDMRIFPIRPNPAVNRGYTEGALDEEGKLLEFTAASAPLVYRGMALPEDFYGNAFVVEPAGNLVKRNVVSEHGFALTSRYAYPESEFLASTDERFRPVNLATGPDGALYIADMYRGIIQHGAYMTPYLRDTTIARGLDKGIHYGRIWRVVPEGWESPAPVRLSEFSSAQLVEHLSHPDGWHRDTAQRLLVERDDPSVLPALKELVRSGASHLGRLHALWTLEGMGASDTALCLDALDDPHPYVRSAAIRLLASTAKREASVRKALGEALAARWREESIDVVLQVAIAAGELGEETALPLLAGIVETFGDQAVIRDAAMSSLFDRESDLMDRLWVSGAWREETPSQSIFLEMLAAAITRKGDAREVGALLARVDIRDPGWKDQAVLTGMAVQASNYAGNPIRLAATPTVFEQESEGDVRARLEEIASMLSWPGHAPVEQVAVEGQELTEREKRLFAMGRQRFLTSCAGCHGADGGGIRRFAPPLVNSEWVLGPERRLILIVLHGLEGPIDVAGQRYDAPDILPVMPPHSVMDDEELASVLTYIRRAWGHAAPPIQPRAVGGIRVTMQGQTAPWKPEELLALPETEE